MDPRFRDDRLCHGFSVGVDRGRGEGHTGLLATDRLFVWCDRDRAAVYLLPESGMDGKNGSATTLIGVLTMAGVVWKFVPIKHSDHVRALSYTSLAGHRFLPEREYTRVSRRRIFIEQESYHGSGTGSAAYRLVVGRTYDPVCGRYPR